MSITDDIDARLEYFAELEQATRMLNHPGESLVLQTDFLYMVERVDICIDYLRNHVRVFDYSPSSMLTLSSSVNIRKQKSIYCDTNNA